MEEAYFIPKERAERLKVTVPAVYAWIDREPRSAIQLKGVGANPQVSVRGIDEACGQITGAETKIRSGASCIVGESCAEINRSEIGGVHSTDLSWRL